MVYPYTFCLKKEDPKAFCACIGLLLLFGRGRLPYAEYFHDLKHAFERQLGGAAFAFEVALPFTVCAACEYHVDGICKACLLFELFWLMVDNRCVPVRVIGRRMFGKAAYDLKRLWFSYAVVGFVYFEYEFGKSAKFYGFFYARTYNAAL